MIGLNLPLLFLFVSLTCVQFGRSSFLPEPAQQANEVYAPEHGNFYQSSSIESDKKIRDMCLKNGGKAAYDNFMTVLNETKTCIKGSDDITDAQDEIRNLMNTWDLGSVFRNSCNKTEEVNKCLRNLMSAAKPCLDESERMIPDNLERLLEAANEFICLTEGDDIILFMFKGGIKCIVDKAEAFAKCADPIIEKYPVQSAPGKSGLGLLKFGKQECQDSFAIQQCVVSEFKKCLAPTPVIFAKSLFNFINKEIPCKNVPGNFIE